MTVTRDGGVYGRVAHPHPNPFGKVGSIQLRQLRMQQGTCNTRYQPITSCVGDFHSGREETGTSSIKF